MNQYEYMQFIPDLEGFVNKKPASNTIDRINEFGTQGWELVTVVPITANMGTSWGGTTGNLIYIFKRLKQ